MDEKGPRIVRTWDEMPTVVYSEGEAFSTRILERKCREMERAMQKFIDRCERREVRSVKTYSEFKEILGI